MSSKIAEALTKLGLVEKYQTKFKEQDVDDWVVEEWLQDSSFNELKVVIATAGDRMRFVRAFQQLSSSSSNGDNQVTNSRSKSSNSCQISSSAPQSSSKTIQSPEQEKTPEAIDETLGNISLSKNKNNSSNGSSSIQQPSLPTQELTFDPPKTAQPKQNPNAAKPKSKTTSALDLMENEFKPRLKLLQSNRYFVYQNAQAEIEEIKTKIRSIFPTFLKLQNQTFKVETEFKKRSAFLNKLNHENKHRVTEVNDQIETRFESLCKSEYQRLKQTAQENIPVPFSWTFDLEKLYGHYDYFLKDLVTPSSSARDLEFQKKCQATCNSKIDELCRLTTFSSSLVNEYSRQMKTELDKAGFIDTESKFTQLHETILSCTFKSCSTNSVTKFPKNLSKCLDDLTKSLILDYERKFREQNNELRTRTDPAAMIEIAVEKYISFMNEKTSKRSDVFFKKSEISEFHKIAYNNIKEYFHSHPANKNTFSWKSSWVKVEGRLKELEKDYQEKNTRKIEKNELLQKISFSAAENEYRKLMNGFVSTHGQGKSLSRDKLNKFHVEAADTALKLYRTKMQGVKEDTKNVEESLIQRFQEERRKLIRENEENAARELKTEKQKIAIETIAAAKDSELQTVSRPPNLNCMTLSMRAYQGGISIHCSYSGVSVVSFDPRTGFTTILENFPPFIAFSWQGIFIGSEAKYLHRTSQYEFVEHNVFSLLSSWKNEGCRAIVEKQSVLLHTEEILACFLRKLAILIADAHSCFHPSSCHVEFVISPFLPLLAKHRIKSALYLAGFLKAHLLQSSSAMALTYFYHHQKELEKSRTPINILAINKRYGVTYDIALFSGSRYTVTNRCQTSRPYFKKPVASWNNLNRGLSSQEIELKGLIESVLEESKLTPMDINHTILVADGPGHGGVVDKVLELVFKREVPTQQLSCCEGMLNGAAAFTAWKAGSPTFSIHFKLEEIHPYFLSVWLSENGGPRLNHPLINRHSPCGQKDVVQTFDVELKGPNGGNTIVVQESTMMAHHANSLAGGIEFEVEEDSKQELVAKGQLEFHISPEGLIDIQWPWGSPWRYKLLIRPKNLWMGKREVESSRAKLMTVFSTMTSPDLTNQLDDPQVVPRMLSSLTHYKQRFV